MRSAPDHTGLDVSVRQWWIIQSPKSGGILILPLEHELVAIDKEIFFQTYNCDYFVKIKE